MKGLNMGVLDFIKNTGEKLTEMGEEAQLAGKIEKRILNLGVKVKGLDVEVDGEIVVLKGYPASEDDRHRAVQIAGNIWGVSKVHDQMILKGEHPGTVKPAKPMKKKARPARPAEKKVKTPRAGGKKVRPSESSRKNVKPGKTGKRRTP